MGLRPQRRKEGDQEVGHDFGWWKRENIDKGMLGVCKRLVQMYQV